MALFVMLKKKTNTPPITKNFPMVTVQIPTYNELAALNCAKRCLDFDYPKDKLQIIIGDDSNDPECKRKIDEFQAKCENSKKIELPILM